MTRAVYRLARASYRRRTTFASLPSPCKPAPLVSSRRARRSAAALSCAPRGLRTSMARGGRNRRGGGGGGGGGGNNTLGVSNGGVHKKSRGGDEAGEQRYNPVRRALALAAARAPRACFRLRIWRALSASYAASARIARFRARSRLTRRAQTQFGNDGDAAAGKRRAGHRGAGRGRRGGGEAQAAAMSTKQLGKTIRCAAADVP